MRTREDVTVIALPPFQFNSNLDAIPIHYYTKSSAHSEISIREAIDCSLFVRARKLWGMLAKSCAHSRRCSETSIRERRRKDGFALEAERINRLPLGALVVHGKHTLKGHFRLAAMCNLRDDTLLYI